MSEASLENRVAAIEAIVQKGESSIDDAVAGLALVGQVQAQIMGDFVHSLSELLSPFMDSLGQIHEAYSGGMEAELEDEEDSLSDGDDKPHLTVIEGGDDPS